MSPIVPSKRTLRRGDPAATLAFQITQGIGATVVREFRFHPTRRWRFDLAIERLVTPDFERSRLVKLAIEIEGGLFVTAGGRHNRGAGMRADMEKYNEAVLLGWRILRVLPEWVQSGKAFTLVERAVKGSK
jgi:hypothetical protein